MKIHLHRVLVPEPKPKLSSLLNEKVAQSAKNFNAFSPKLHTSCFEIVNASPYLTSYNVLFIYHHSVVMLSLFSSVRPRELLLFDAYVCLLTWIHVCIFSVLSVTVKTYLSITNYLSSYMRKTAVDASSNAHIGLHAASQIMLQKPSTSCNLQSFR